MKKQLACLLAGTLLAVTLAACGKPTPVANRQSGGEAPGQLRIVATTFPQYDWMRQILGERMGEVELTLLLDDGVDLHSYQPTMEDIEKISTCDLFVYVGGESDAWVHDALATSINQDRVAVNLLEALGDRVKAEEIIEGMEHTHGHEDEEDHDQDHEEDHNAEDHHGEAHDHHGQPDEHIWLSLKNAQVLCARLAGELEKLDGVHGATYRANAQAYARQLALLDAQYQAAVDSAPVKTLLFGDRFPFRYLADDYGLSYYAAFSGCSAETEASFETIVFLSGKLDELTLGHVMVIDGSNQAIAETIIENTTAKNQEIVELDSMQSVTARDMAGGTTYLSVMERNLAALKQALA